MSAYFDTAFGAWHSVLCAWLVLLMLINLRLAFWMPTRALRVVALVGVFSSAFLLWGAL